MRASFFEFNVAMSGIFTAKSALNVASHNIANASNENYSRQVALQRASQPLTFYDGRGMVGTGSEVYGVGQIRSAYLDQKYWSEKAVLGEYSVKSQLLSLSQTIFDPLAETGLSASFDNFFNSLKDLQTNSIDDTYRGNVMQVATTLSKFVNSTYESLVKQQSDINDEVRATVQAINNIGVQIRNLNEQIMKYELDGSNANDLRDQRAALVDKLSGYVNVQVKEELVEIPHTNGRMQKQFSVQINGSDLVKHTQNRNLTVVARTEKANPEDADGLYDVCWAPSNVKFDMYHPNLSGELKALIDLRDGNNGENFKGALTDIIRFNASVKDVTQNPVTPPTYTLEFDTTNNETLSMLKAGDTFVVDDVTYKVHDASEMPNKAIVSIEDGDPTDVVGSLNGKNITTEKGNTTITLKGVNRLDILQTGKITIVDTQTGNPVEYTFDSFNVDADGNVTLNITNMTPKDLARHDVASEPSVVSGKSSTYKGIPYYISRLNEMVRTFSKAVNEGLDHNDKPIPDVTGFVNGYQDGNKNGYLMFTYTDASGKEMTTGPIDYNNINAKNFSASNFLTKNPSLVATSTTANDGESKNDLILNFSSIVNYKSLFREGTIKDYSASISTEMAIDLRQSTNFDINYTDVVMAIDYQRKAVMSVDPDEEGMNIIKYNQLMQTSAKLINVINDMYDTLINRLGV